MFRKQKYLRTDIDIDYREIPHHRRAKYPIKYPNMSSPETSVWKFLTILNFNPLRRKSIYVLPTENEISRAVLITPFTV